MSKLNNNVSRIQAKSNPQKAKDYSLPEYGEHGEIVRKAIKIPKWILWFFGIIGLIFAILYIPSIPYLFPKAVADGTPVYIDSSMIRVAQEYYRDAPTMDFDGDGLSNEAEAQYGTNIFRADTDWDGIGDYIELHTYNTSPTSSNGTFVEYIKALSQQEGKNAGSPYKINDVVMWPSNWTSRAYGGVVRTVNGYRFCNFNGWAQFPYDNVYAYKVVDGRHVMLEYRATEKAWKITDDSEIFLFDEPLKTYYEITLLNKNKYYWEEEEGWKGKLMKVASILAPKESLLLSIKEATVYDINDTLRVVVKNEPQQCSKDYPINRFSKNMNSLSDLASVYETLKDGYCLLISFYVENEGEAIVEAYGYDSNGGILVCDPNDFTPLGTIHIVEKTSRSMIYQDDVQITEWFSFYGCGIDSRNKNVQIRFFNQTGPIKEAPKPKPIVTPQPQTDPEPEFVLEGPGILGDYQSELYYWINEIFTCVKGDESETIEEDAA